MLVDVQSVAGGSNGFSWKSCGEKTDIVIIDKIAVSPDKLVIPGVVSVTGSGTIKTRIESPISVSSKREIW